MSSSRVKGFSLPELVLVIVVIGILGTLVYPLWGRFMEKLDINSAANELKSYLNLAKTLAMADVSTHAGVHFDPVNGQYLLFLDKNTSGSEKNKYGPGDDVRKGPATLPEKVSFQIVGTASDVLSSGYPKAVVFRGDGSAKSGQGVNIQLTSTKYGYTRTINVLPSTGRLKVIQ